LSPWKFGSSPRAWGTDWSLFCLGGFDRFIPTGVGNGLSKISGFCPNAVHPHGRGERGRSGYDRNRPDGSSPRAWGTGSFRLRVPRLLRFIPTGVGNGPERSSEARAISVHPHGRGERTNVSHTGCTSDGSSPRAWGTDAGALRVFAPIRFIPTGVGNGWRPRSRMGLPSVHPHGRGERPNIQRRPAALSGSSPRAWGTGGAVVRLRIVPSVHPHGRGEREDSNDWVVAGYGSSPRAWGTAAYFSVPNLYWRFIPTGVGNGLRGILAA